MKNTEILLKFTRDLKALVDDFSEEMEILANDELMSQIRESEKERKKGAVKTFENIDELKQELGL
jgi:hypothetical protein